MRDWRAIGADAGETRAKRPWTEEEILWGRDGIPGLSGTFTRLLNDNFTTRAVTSEAVEAPPASEDPEDRDYSRWSEADDQVTVQRYLAGDRMDAIARDLGRTTEAVRRRVAHLRAAGGVSYQRQPKRAWSQAEFEEIRQCRAEGYKTAEIAQILGRPVDRVQKTIGRLLAAGKLSRIAPGRNGR